MISVTPTVSGAGASAFERFKRARYEATSQVIPQTSNSLSPNAREISLLGTAAAEESTQESLCSAVASAVSAAVLANESLAQLWKIGVLQLEISFWTNCSQTLEGPSYIYFEKGMSVRVPIRSGFGDVPEELAFKIKQKIQSDINPKHVQIACTDKNGRAEKSIIDKIYLYVSNCRQMIHLNRNGEIIKEEPPYETHTHQGTSLNSIQTILHNTELMHQQIKPDRSKIEKIARELFSSTFPWTAFNTLVNQVQRKEVGGKLWLRLIFNSKETNGIRIPAKDGTYYSENISGLVLMEIAELFQVIKSRQYLGALPACTFPKIEEGRMSSGLNLFYEGSGLKNEYRFLIADYLIHE